jgi:hypothetical protein
VVNGVGDILQPTNPSEDQSMKSGYTDQFGYLPIDCTLEFAGGLVAPMPDFKKARQDVSNRTQSDGYIYPPIVCTRTKKPGWKRWKKVPYSERQQLLHRLPSTHYLELYDTFRDQEEARYSVAGFVMHFLGFLYGHRCHFHDWWVDGRVLIKGDIDYSPPRPEKAQEILNHASQTWHNFRERQRQVAINVLALPLHARTPFYEMEWERFASEYQLLDAVCWLAGGRDKAMRRLCQRFKIAVDTQKIDRLIRLRNDLLHQVLWDNRMPGEARSESSFYASYWLHKLTRRAMLGVLGFQGQYIRTPWWGRGSFHFDVVYPEPAAG